MDITTKDGIVVSGIPDTMDKNDQRLKDLVAKLRASGQKKATYTEAPAAIPEAQALLPANPSQPQDFQAAPAEAQAPAQPQTFLEWLTPNKNDLGATARGAVGGIASPATMFMDPAMELINLVLPENMKQLPPSQAIQMFLGMMGVPEAETKAQKLLQATTAGLASGGANALAGKALSSAPGTVGAVGGQMAAQPVQQMASGAAAGAASEGAAQAGAGPGGQLAAGLAGGVVGAKASGVRGVPSPVGPVQEADQAGVRLMTSDVRQPNTFAGRWLRSATEKIPVAGTGPVRAAQQTERIAAVKDLVRQYGAEDLQAVSDDVMADLLAKRSADLGKWSQAKNEVIEALSIPTGGSAKALSASGAPLSIEAYASQVPTKYVPVPATTQKIDDSIAFLNQLKTAQVKPLIAVLEDWKQAIQGQDLRNIELLRKQIGEAFKAPELASVRSTGERILSDIYGSVKEDMTSYIKTAGGEQALTKWQVANKELSKAMGELDLGAMKTALNKGEMTPEAVKALLFSAKKSDVEALYRNLSPAGQASARSAVIAKAAQDARVSTEQAGGDYISPDKFMNNVKKLGTQVGVVFGEEDSKQLQGLMRVLDYTKRAGTAAALPPTGVQLAIPAGAAALTQVFGSGISGLIGTVAAGAGIGGMARVYESKTVRDILTKLPTLKAGGPEEAALLKRLIVAVQVEQNRSREAAKEDQQALPAAMPN